MTLSKFSRRSFVGTSVGAGLAVPAAAIAGHQGASAQDIIQWTPADSILPELTPIADLQPAPEDEVHMTWSPRVPPPIQRSDQRTWEIHLDSIEGVCPLDPAGGVYTEMWGFRMAGETDVLCGSPGPTIRGRVGDYVTISMTNLASSRHPHNIDFHAVTGQGGGAEGLTAVPGETRTITARLMYPGAFMYHCAYDDVPSHVAHGMYGIFIVDPEVPLPPVDHEWAISQSEWYVSEPGPTDEGVAPFNRDALVDEHPRYFTFNGRTDALIGDNALRMNVGERARIYFVNQGLNKVSSFHPIGSHWDVVYPESSTHPANTVIRGSQSTLVVAGGGTVTELQAFQPSTLILVDHALSRAFYKGLIGHIVIEGEENPEVFSAPEVEEVAQVQATPTAEIDVEVVIPEGAFMPDHSAHAYDPPLVEVPVGTTIRWTNNDIVAHTVTSGVSDGLAGVPDGVFDSGFMDAGATWVHTLEQAGVFPYFCVPHPWMRGTLVVTA
ncbi:MAG: plastocyanin/azurin family copper-binding protein [Thermomicrobiales bacterium]